MKKTYFNVIVFLLIIFISSCAPRRNRIPKQPTMPQVAQALEIRAPWEVWPVDTLGDLDLAQADTALSRNAFDQAISLYRQALRSSSNPNVRDQARLRMISTLLKSGKSTEALQEIASYTQEIGITPQELRPDYALLVAWAYVHQRQSDQSFAWFRVSSRVLDKGSQVAIASRKGVRSSLKSLSPSEFENIYQKWSADDILSRYFKEEKIRRIREGENTSYSLAKFFTPDFYQGKQVIEQSVVAPVISEDLEIGEKIKIGVLLPLTGKFSEHANKVKQGIELAANEVDLKFGDTQGDALIAVSEYERLVTQEKVNIVLGPMLVATSEAVGDKSVSLGVPILSFTKKEGLPGIGSTVFRLGATASNQVQEILNYTTSQLNLNSFAIIYPSNDNSADLVAEFEKEASNKGVQITTRQLYSPGDLDSIKLAVESVASTQPQAIFIPDNLESCFPVLEQIKAQGLVAVILGSALWSDQVAIRGYGQLLEGAYFVSLFNSHSEDPSIVGFLNSFREHYKHSPELLAAQSYDATNFVIHAFKNTTGSASQRLLSASPYIGITGELKVQADGEITRKISVMNVVKGDALEVMFAGQPRGVMPVAAQ